MNEMISVIVPIYNVEKYLLRCVSSIQNQTYKNIEILLIDDGSTDNSGNICDELQKDDARIKTFHKKNGGLSDARNYGIKKAKGEYLAFIDSDDYIDEDMFEYLYKQLIENNADISICGKYINYEGGCQVEVNNSNKKMLMNREEALVNINSFVGFDMSACDKLYRRFLFNDVSFPYGKKCEDFYTMYQLFDKCQNNIVYNAVSKYHYFQREGSISRSPNMDTSYIEASLSQVNFFKEKYPKLLYAAKSMYVFANLSLYNRYIRYGLKCPSDTIRDIKKVVRGNALIVIKNKHLPIIKKFQVICFLFSKRIYKFVMKKKMFSN